MPAAGEGVNGWGMLGAGSDAVDGANSQETAETGVDVERMIPMEDGIPRIEMAQAMARRWCRRECVWWVASAKMVGDDTMQY